MAKGFCRCDEVKGFELQRGSSIILAMIASLKEKDGAGRHRAPLCEKDSPLPPGFDDEGRNCEAEDDN